MPRFINESFRRSIGRGTKMEVTLAATGDRLAHRRVFIAPSDHHLAIVRNRMFRLIDGPKVNYVKPSVDVTMRSVGASDEDRLLGIIMTGLGRDGAEGLGHLRSLGAETIAQDEGTSTIYGMPKAALEVGAVGMVLTPREIRGALIERFALLASRR
jgi:two-component system chemotaxis response regulator CheB